MASKDTYDRFFAALADIRNEAAGSWGDKKDALDRYLKDNPEAQEGIRELVEWYKDPDAYTETGTATGGGDETHADAIQEERTAEENAAPENALVNDSKVS